MSTTRLDMTDSIERTLAERGARYGNFPEVAQTAQSLKLTLRTAVDRRGCPVEVRQALDAIADKLARIVNGDPTYVDNWHDIQGYARLVEDAIEGGCDAQRG